jgi:hypothetical protein
MKVEVDGQESAGEQLECHDRRTEDKGIAGVALDYAHALPADIGFALFGALLIAVRSLSVSFLACHGPSLPLDGNRHDVDGLERR